MTSNCLLDGRHCEYKFVELVHGMGGMVNSGEGIRRMINTFLRQKCLKESWMLAFERKKF